MLDLDMQLMLIMIYMLGGIIELVNYESEAQQAKMLRLQYHDLGTGMYEKY